MLEPISIDRPSQALAVPVMRLDTPRSEVELPPIVTPPMLALSGVMVAAMSGLYLLMSAVPAHAAALGGPPAAGWATGVLMGATIVGEFVAPRLIASIGRRAALMLALTIMGLSCLAAFSERLSVVMLSCALRGAALGLLLVAACGLAVLLAPASRRAEAMGFYGMASAIPAIACVPLGPWMVAQFEPRTISLVAAGLVLAGLWGALMPFASAGSLQADPHSHRAPPLRLAAWPVIALGTGAIVVGATITFLPIAHPEASPGGIAAALLLQGLAGAVARWAAGRPIDRKGPRAAAVGGAAMALVGALCLALPGDMAVIAGALVSGGAFGVLQSASLSQLMARAGPTGGDGVGALWNGAYDAGLGIGGVAFGLLAAGVGYAAAFVVLTVGLALLALLTFQLFEGRGVAC